MKLSKQDADLFFQLMWSLQFYVNDKFNIIPDVTSIENYIDLAQEDKIIVREKLFDHPNLINEYIALNPDGLDKDKLLIIKGWKSFVKGEFHIERYLKNYAIFIGAKKVYAVVALYEGFDEMIHKSYLPLYTKAILLPFKSQIIYDGLMQSYNMSFGGGIKRSLKETYMTAKQNDRIITSLEENNVTIKKEETQTKDWSPEIIELSSLAKKLKGGSDQPAINSSIFSLIKSSIELANKAVVEQGEYNELNKELKKVRKFVKQIETILYRMD